MDHGSKARGLGGSGPKLPGISPPARSGAGAQLGARAGGAAGRGRGRSSDPRAETNATRDTNDSRRRLEVLKIRFATPVVVVSGLNQGGEFARGLLDGPTAGPYRCFSHGSPSPIHHGHQSTAVK